MEADGYLRQFTTVTWDGQNPVHVTFALAPLRPIAEVTIVDAVTDEPLEGAWAEIYFKDPGTGQELFECNAHTDASGTCTLHDVRGYGAGDYVIYAGRTGYFEACQPISWDGQSPVQVRFALAPWKAVAHVTVTDAGSGGLLQNALVALFFIDPGTGEARYTHSAWTDASGTCTLYDSEGYGPGQYLIEARATGYVAERETVTWDGGNPLEISMSIGILAGDAYEPDNSVADAKTFVPGSGVQRRTLFPGGDVDWVKVDVVQDKRYVFVTQMWDRMVDTYLELYDSNGTTLIASDDDSGGNFFSRIEWTADGTKSVYLKVRGYNSSVTGPYCLAVIRVNHPPVVESDAYATDEDTPLSVDAAGVLANDCDVDGDPLSAVLVEGPAHGELELCADGGFAYTPDADWHGTDAFCYKALDGELESAPATVTIEVRPVNDAPVAKDDAYTVSYNVTATVDAAAGVLANDADPDGDQLRAVLAQGAAHGTLSLAADGSFVYKPDAGFTGFDSFTYRAEDAELSSKPATVTIEVLPIASVPVAGADRIATAIEASKLAFPDGADAVVIAAAYNWPDALGGAALAGAAGGPVLLTPKDALPSSVASEVRRLGATKAYVLGGEGAVSAAVETALKAQLGKDNVERLAGSNRYETARMVAAECVALQGPAFDGTAFLATGANFPDALGASPAAAAKGWPIFLVDPAKGADAALVAAMQAAGVRKAIVLGGTGAISDAVKADVARLVPCSTDRWWGADRYATAAAVAGKSAAAGLAWDGLGIATGENFPDALAAGPVLGRSGSVMLLTRTASLPEPTRAALSANKREVSTVRFFGGTGAITQPVRDAVLEALK